LISGSFTFNFNFILIFNFNFILIFGFTVAFFFFFFFSQNFETLTHLLSSSSSSSRTKWVNSEIYEFMRIYLVYIPIISRGSSDLYQEPFSQPPTPLASSPPTPSSSVPTSPGSTRSQLLLSRRTPSLIRLSSRVGSELVTPRGSHLPFKTGRTDTLERGFAIVYFDDQSPYPHHEQTPVRPLMRKRWEFCLFYPFPDL